MTREGGILPVLNALKFGLKEYYAFLCIMFLQASFINTGKGKKEKKKLMCRNWRIKIVLNTFSVLSLRVTHTVKRP